MRAKRVAWILGVAATLYLLFALYVWTVAILGIHLPLSRQLPFPPLQWLVQTQHLSDLVVTVLLALVLVFVVSHVRRRRFELRVPRWGFVMVALMLVAVVTEAVAVVWQYYIWDPSCRGCTMEQKFHNIRTQDVREYVGIVARSAGYWSLLVLVAGALASSRPIDEDVSTAPGT